MTSHPSHCPVCALRELMIEAMTVPGFKKTLSDYVRNVGTFAAFMVARRIPRQQRIYAAPSRTRRRAVCSRPERQTMTGASAGC